MTFSDHMLSRDFSARETRRTWELCLEFLEELRGGGCVLSLLLTWDKIGIFWGQTLTLGGKAVISGMVACDLQWATAHCTWDGHTEFLVESVPGENSQSLAEW